MRNVNVELIPSSYTELTNISLLITIDLLKAEISMLDKEVEMLRKESQEYRDKVFNEAKQSMCNLLSAVAQAKQFVGVA